MGRKSVKAATQAMNANLINKGTTQGSNAVGKVNFSSIRCHVCKKVKPNEQYSNRQILRHQHSIFNPFTGGPSKEHATCKECVVGGVEELWCFMCSSVKPLSAFMKSQRQKGEKARCRGCVQYCLDTELTHATPDLDEYVEDSDDESDVDEQDDEDDDEGEEDEDTSDEDVDGPPPAKPATIKPAASKPAASKPAVSKPAVSKPAVSKPAVSKPAVSKPTTSKPTTSKPPTTSTANLARQMASMTVSSNRPPPVITPQSPVIPPDDGDDDNDGWHTVPVASKSNSAYRASSTWASRAASAVASPPPTWASRAASAVASPPARTAPTLSTAGSRVTTSGFATPQSKGQTEPTTQTLGTPGSRTTPASTGGAWGKPAKLKMKPGEVVQDEWMTRTAERNGWLPYGGQPVLLKKKNAKKRQEEFDESDDDDDEE